MAVDLSESIDASFSLLALLASEDREVYVVNAASMSFVTASFLALKTLNRDVETLQSLTLEDIFHETTNAVVRQEIHLYKDQDQVIETILHMNTTSGNIIYELRMVYVKNQSKQAIIVTRSKIEGALNKSFLETLISQIPNLIFEARTTQDQSLTFDYFNHDARALLGFSSSVLCKDSQQFINAIQTKDRASFFDSMAQAAKHKTVWNWTGEISNEEWNDFKLINLRATPNKDQGTETLWYGVIENITDSHTKQLSLSNISARYETIVSNIPSLVFQSHLNESGQLIFDYLSEGCKALLGLKAETLLAHPEKLYDLVIPKDRASFLLTMQESARKLDIWNWEGGVWIEEWQDVKLINLRATASINSLGVTQWGGVITNITQSKKERQALDELTSRFQAIVSNIPSLVFQCAQSVNHELQFNYLSSGCQAVLGVAPEELIEEPTKLLEMILPADRPSFLESMRVSAEDLSVWNWEGGLWIEEWKDIKLVNLRAMARVNSEGQVEWDGVITNITQSRREKAEIEESHRQLAELSSHMSMIKEQERLRIAREIHDDLGGNLTAIKIGISSLTTALETSNPKLFKRAKMLEGLVDQTFNEAHRITSDLRPNVLELGIVAALRWLAGEFEKQIGLPCYFHANDEQLVLSENQAIVLFRICQEATMNIAKHAHANAVEIELSSNQKEVVMRVIDDGVGIPAEAKIKKNAFGLRGMHERVVTVGGKVDIESDEHGTTIAVTLPLSN